MPGLEEGKGSHYLMGMEFRFCKMKSPGDCLHNKVNVLNTTELYTENGKDNKWTNTS